jgi:hypothetical protein
MDVLELLKSGDRDRLVALGASAVHLTLAEMCNEDSSIDSGLCSDVLRRIGEPAIAPIVEAIAADPGYEISHRLRRTFTTVEVSDLAAYAPYLAHPHRAVRENVLAALQGRIAVPEVAIVLPALLDVDEDVRQRARWVLRELGEDVLPLLRDLRRTPGRMRRPALEMLVDIAGPQALDTSDLAAIRRLIKLKVPDERPAPMHLCGSWYALRTTDQAAVLAAFELSDPEPVTMRLGESAWNNDHHMWSAGREHTRCARAYVSPVIDGWTLVFGRGPYEEHLADDMRLGRLAELSNLFGVAHLYGMSCGDEWTEWAIAEDGRILRHYNVEEPDHQIGSGHPAEDGYLLPHVDAFPADAFAGIDLSDSRAFSARYSQVKHDLGIPDPCDATIVAARVSVDPSSLGTGNRVSGVGVLALSVCGRNYGHPSGALRI